MPLTLLVSNFAIFVICAVCLAAVIAGILLYLATRAPPEVPAVLIQLVDDERYFLSSMSTDMKNGRDDMGNLTIDDSQKESGLSTKEALGRYPLTFCAGHDAYKSGRIKNDKLAFTGRDSSWNSYVRRVAGRAVLDGQALAGTGVLEITPELTGGAFVYLDSSVDLAGIVVRHGGVLFILCDAKTVTLRVGWILVESGGLFQAGSPYLGVNGSSMRLTNPTDGSLRALEILVATPDTYQYSRSGELASQYAYTVYAPGVRKATGTEQQKYTSYTGTDAVFCNMFGARCAVAVGFNGNATFAGSLGRPQDVVQYTGTWGARVKGTNESWLGADELMTTGAQGLFEIEDAYAPTWTHLDGKDEYTAGDTQITLDASFAGKIDHWIPGSKLLITCKTEQFSSAENVDGRTPIWMDWDDDAQRRENEAANDDQLNLSIKNAVDGIEVATVKRVVPGTAIIELVSGLKYRHLNKRAEITRNHAGVTEGTIQVDTRVHVGLLTRNIRISSELNTTSKGGGANVWRFDDMNTPHQHTGYIGPGGTVMCNYQGLNCNEDNTACGAKEVYDFCYKPAYSASDMNLCPGDANASKPVHNDVVEGSWLFGTAGLVGGNAILGAHTMVMSGGSMHFDGVELFRLGMAGNYGAVARYPFHCHMAGFVRPLRAYLPEGSGLQDTRVADLTNSSVWPSYNRWATLHGTSTARIANNVCFVSLGSGMFTEDGMEVLNSIEHNMMAATLRCGTDNYYNKMDNSYLIPVVSSDSTFPSNVWLKNNRNACLRNVMCNSIAPVVAVWWVPQNNASLRGMPSVILGDPELGLPGTASYMNATGQDQGMKAYLSQYKNVSMTNPPCYSPQYLVDAGFSGTDGCMLDAVKNDNIAPLLCCENIVYCHGGGVTNFPDSYFSLTSTLFKAYQNATIVQKVMYPSWIPSGGQNECTDKQNVSSTVYCEPRWNRLRTTQQADAQPRKLYQPIEKTEFDVLQGDCAVRTLGLGSEALPLTIVALLTFNVAPMSGALALGPGWTKSPVMLLNCCFLVAGGGTRVGSEEWAVEKSGMFTAVVGDAVNRFPNVYHTYYNLLADRAVTFLPNPTLYAGEKTFIGSGAKAIVTEYTGAGELKNGGRRDVAVANYFFDSSITSKVIPDSCWRDVAWYSNNNSISYFYLYDLKTLSISRGVFGRTTAPETQGAFQQTFSRKYAYLCSQAGKLLKDEAAPGGVVDNEVSGVWLNTYARRIGDEICQLLGNIKKCDAPTAASGLDGSVAPTGLYGCDEYKTCTGQ